MRTCLKSTEGNCFNWKEVKKKQLWFPATETICNLRTKWSNASSDLCGHQSHIRRYRSNTHKMNDFIIKTFLKRSEGEKKANYRENNNLLWEECRLTSASWSWDRRKGLPLAHQTGNLSYLSQRQPLIKTDNDEPRGRKSRTEGGGGMSLTLASRT